MPGAQLNINPARAITWLIGVNIYHTFFNYNSLPLSQFLWNKTLLKKTSYSKGTLIEQIFELRGPRPPGRIYSIEQNIAEHIILNTAIMINVVFEFINISTFKIILCTYSIYKIILCTQYKLVKCYVI